MASHPGSPPSCSLGISAFLGRAQDIAALNRQFLRSSRREGRTLTLVYDLAARQEVETLVDKERRCCSLLHFEVRSGETVDVEITWPARADGEAERLVALLQSSKGAGPVRLGAGGIVFAASATALACGACCGIPMAWPAIMLSMAGGALAWLGRAYAWMTGLAVVGVLGAWIWVWARHRGTRLRVSRMTLGWLGVASLMTLLAVAWPRIETSLLAAWGL